MVVQVMGLRLPEYRRQVGWRTAGQAMVLRDQGREVLDIRGRAVLAVRRRLDSARCHRRFSRCRRTLSPDPMVSLLRSSPAHRIRSQVPVTRCSRVCRTRDLPSRDRSRLPGMTTAVSPHPNRASTWVLRAQADPSSQM